jgi:hypothetical protein
MDDRDAISCIKQGDLNGLEFLVNHYQVRAVHAAYLILYDRALSEDIALRPFVGASYALSDMGVVTAVPGVPFPNVK